jgi:hypothetical protein
MMGAGCRPGEQPKGPADKPPARALAFPGETGVRTVVAWFVIDGVASAAVSYTKRMVVTRLAGDGDPDEDTVTGETPGHSPWGMTSVSANGRRDPSFRECGRVRSALAS